MQDVFVAGNNMVSLSLSENAVDGGVDSCVISSGGDPESPVCARLVLSGQYVNVSGTSEESFAQSALMTRHPQMDTWPVDHSWFYAKLVITDIWLIDIYGGASILDVDQYYAVNMTDISLKKN
mmetsp:Transcript_8583/g.11192  ORF Transcript_8583/g.11192 Transcript_8583/m.11192 type:complete len:123 (-) Transcript_8583:271-639(-)